MSKYIIGDVVTLTTHPFTFETNNVVISGEYQMIPPLMVVIEVMDDKAISVAESIDVKYKCLWFSSKDMLFKENYFLEADLKKTALERNHVQSEIQIGNLVGLSTMLTELGKKRSFLHTETQKNTTKKTSSVTSLLTFISPVLQVIAIKDFDPANDKKSESKPKKRSTHPEKIVKCKWFNSISEKFSEAWIPAEALMLIPKVPSKLLEFVRLAIENDRHIKLETTIIRPIQISNRSGFYHLECFDYVTQQNESIPINDLVRAKSSIKTIKALAPSFKKRMSKGKSVLKITLTVQKLIKNALARPSAHFISIKYRDKFGNISNRTISKYRLILGDGDIEDSGKLIMYVNAHCHLRDAERNFRLDSILEAIELDLKS